MASISYIILTSTHNIDSEQQQKQLKADVDRMINTIGNIVADGVSEITMMMMMMLMMLLSMFMMIVMMNVCMYVCMMIYAMMMHARLSMVMHANGYDMMVYDV